MSALMGCIVCLEPRPAPRLIARARRFGALVSDLVLCQPCGCAIEESAAYLEQHPAPPSQKPEPVTTNTPFQTEPVATNIPLQTEPVATNIPLQTEPVSIQCTFCLCSAANCKKIFNARLVYEVRSWFKKQRLFLSFGPELSLLQGEKRATFLGAVWVCDGCGSRAAQAQEDRELN